MIDAFLILVATALAMFIAHAAFGFTVTYEIAYGSFTLMAAMISLTFLWLWRERATPLAGGMALGWAGASSVMGWWWLYNVAGRPVAMQSNPALFLCLALYFTGAVLHFVLIRRSFGFRQLSIVVPIGAAVAVSVTIRALF